MANKKEEDEEKDPEAAEDAEDEGSDSVKEKTHYIEENAKLRGRLSAKDEQIEALKEQVHSVTAELKEFKDKYEADLKKRERSVNEEFEHCFPEKDASEYDIDVKQLMVDGYKSGLESAKNEHEHSLKMNGQTKPPVKRKKSQNGDGVDTVSRAMGFR